MKQWKHCWYLDFLIIFGILIVKHYVLLLFKKKIGKVLIFSIVDFSNFKINAALQLAPPSNKRRESLLEELRYTYPYKHCKIIHVSGQAQERKITALNDTSNWKTLSYCKICFGEKSKVSFHGLFGVFWSKSTLQSFIFQSKKVF